MKARWHTCTTLILLLVLIAACRSSGDDSKPSITILSPPDQYTITLGETVEIESRSKDDGGVRQVELRVDDAQAELHDVPEGEKSYRVVQSWSPSQVGSHRVTVVAHDNKGQASEPATITINVQPGPTQTSAPQPTATPELMSTPGQASPAPGGCTHNSAFVTDVTIPDNTPLTPGAEFVKTWRLRNNGDCEWGAGFKFVFTKGEQMSGPASVDVPPTPAGATADISVPLKAPQEPGTYRGTWRMRAPDGQEFGERPFVQIVVTAPGTATPPITPTATWAPKSDLDITLVAGDVDLLVGESLALRVTVTNLGPAATDQPAVVRAVLWADFEIDSSVPTLPSGGQEIALISHTFDEPVDLEVVISVDPDNEIPEEDEDNNIERVPVVVNPPLYVTGVFTATPGLGFDLDDGATDEDRLDIEWRVVEGAVYVGLRNGAGAAALSGAAESVSYALTAGLTWETEQLPLPDLAEGSMFGFRTSDGRVGYAHVEEVLDEARTSARLTYLIWDWP